MTPCGAIKALLHWRRQYVPRGSRPSEEQIQEFYKTDWNWKRLRYDFIKWCRAKGVWQCGACNRDQGDGAKIVVDHIEPIRTHWQLRFVWDNLQPLCNDCNMGKGSRDQTDWRRWA